MESDKNNIAEPLLPKKNERTKPEPKPKAVSSINNVDSPKEKNKQKAENEKNGENSKDKEAKKDSSNEKDNESQQKDMEGDEDESSHYKDTSMYEITPEIASKDPTMLKKVSLGTDFYSLTWFSLKKGAFKGKKIRGRSISLLPQDYFWIYINFLTFVGLLVVTVILIVQEALIDDIYVEGDWSMSFLRILLVIFTQMNLSPEIELGYAKFLYPIINHHEFYHPSMAIFIGFAHVLSCILTMLGLIFFICMADEFADPVINFAGITVLSQLDDWIGDVIINTWKLDSDKAEEEEDENEKEILIKSRSKYDRNYLNEKMNVYSKMAMLADDKNEIYIDENLFTKAPWYIVFFEKAFSFIPWRIVLPLSTIPLSSFLPYLTVKVRNYFGYNI